MTGRSLLSFAASLALASSASAQVVIRVPFVRIQTGGPGGTYVQAPFVNVYSPPPPGFVYFGPQPPPVFYGPPPGFGVPGGVPIPGPVPAQGENPQQPQNPFPVAPPQPPQPLLPKVPQPLPAGPDLQLPEVKQDANKPEPKNDVDFVPPAPAQVPAALSLEQFAKSFKPRAGNYEITLTNPVNNQKETVRFSLPGEPREVRTGRDTIEFVYGPRRFVRIEFDQDGPTVITR